MTQQDDGNIGARFANRAPQPPEPRRVLPKGTLVGLALSLLCLVIWYAYPPKKADVPTADVPVITADKTPYKFKPQDPGGMEVRHQDSTVFDPLENKSPDTVEKLSPQAEQPMNKDKAVAIARAQDKAPVVHTAKTADTRVKTLPDGTEKIITGPAIVSADRAGRSVAPPRIIHPQGAPVAVPAPAQPQEKQASVQKTAPEVAKTAAKTALPAASGIYVQLGAFRDEASAKTAWSALLKKYPAALKGLTMNTQRVDLGAKGVLHRLQAGRVTSKDAAQKICAALKTGCIVVVR